MDENGMKFDEGEVDELTHALFHDATISDQNTTSNVASSSLSHPQTSSGAAVVEEGGAPANLGQGITFDALKAQLTKHEGLLQNLSISIDRWLVPPKVIFNFISMQSIFALYYNGELYHSLISMLIFDITISATKAKHILGSIYIQNHTKTIISALRTKQRTIHYV